MAAKDTATVIALSDAIGFSPDARVNKELLTASMAEVRMNCYEPGQITPMHMHPDEEEVMIVIEGRGAVLFEEQDELPIKQGDLIHLPSDQFHAIKAADDSRMVLVYFMKPGYSSRRPDRPAENAAISKLHGER
ncbi:MAG: cupin domain-containing protein [Rhodospirillaceae bacterium]|nr:cupin domain-containing protein [Rhodospirillaceae bacterium]